MVLRSACMPNTIWQAPGRRRPVARRTERSAPRACPSPEALKEASLQGTALSTGSGSTTRLSRHLFPTPHSLPPSRRGGQGAGHNRGNPGARKK